MPCIDYNHSLNLHSPQAPNTIVGLLLKQFSPSSVLDVGCGTGVWLREFMKCNVTDVYGIDGVSIEKREFLSDRCRFQCVDLSSKWNLERKFDLALCLEVVEHLPPESAAGLIRLLCAHSDHIVFSAACPHQPGQGHINTQWPGYWQAIFNDNGFSCNDSLRFSIWAEPFHEFWYKQNIFIAIRDSENAGSEERILPLVHPQLLQGWVEEYESQRALINGELGLRSSICQTLTMLSNASVSAIRRKLCL
jgi:SAM-dependent methyltransferase